MKITLAKNIDAPDCAVCDHLRPWDSTLAELKAKLRAHGVTWPHFVVMHGKNKSCSRAGLGVHDRGLYVVATNAHGAKDTSAIIFARKAPYYVGVSSILHDRAFS